mmetsp:Transcript_64778/g.163076  ORF Transcript_64778/g.163076 Transcript_64778/m.163076 type:complete len:647 (-) Transcript_64778:49-1989(-)
MVHDDNPYALTPSRRSRSKSPTPFQTGIVTAGKATRTIEILNEDGTECITIGASATAKATEVCEIIGGLCSLDPERIRLIKQVGSYSQAQSYFDDVASRVTAMGVKSFQRPVTRHEHPIMVIGAGLGGIQTMMRLKQKGHDFVCLEKLDDFGGHSWMVVANKFTKLQTERGTYFCDYILPGVEPPKFFGDVPYNTWPSRDQLLTMFRESARDHGLYESTRFNMSVEKVKQLPSSTTTVGDALVPAAFRQQISGKNRYGLAVVPVDEPDEAGELLIGSAVLAWPGNLCDCREIEFPGEDLFDGYIEYSSFGKMDYTQCAGKEVILYGHGAFTIENVRTLVEHRCKKVIVMCRKRNLCGMKIVSWMVAHLDVPVPGNIMLEAFQKIYDLVGFDVWSAHSVKTDANRSFAHISQKTVFGVTDIYFLAGYYGLMEVVVDEVKRLTHHCAHTKKGKKIECEVILKAVGTVPSFKIDKMLGLKELHGIWVNNDPLRPVACNGMFVEARNFGSFSSGPGFASTVAAITWFVDYPDDFEVIRGQLPINKASDRPAYVPSGTHLMPTFGAVGQLLPLCAAAMAEMDQQKHLKQRMTHPPREYIAQCRHEWESYIRVFKKFGMVDDRPEPPYPYTEEMVQDWMDRSTSYWVMRAGK